MKFSARDQETIFNYNQEEDVCRIYTRNRGVAGELKRLGYDIKKTITNGNDSFVSAEFEVPKDRIKVLPKKGK